MARHFTFLFALPKLINIVHSVFFTLPVGEPGPSTGKNAVVNTQYFGGEIAELELNKG